MMRLGVLSFSDGRERVHLSLSPYIRSREEELVRSLKELGVGTEIFVSDIMINDAAAAREQAEKMLRLSLDCIVFNVPVFAFPAFPAMARKILHDIPCAVVSAADPAYPGLGGLNAVVNMIRQKGMSCEKIWGSVSDERNNKKLLAFLRAAYATTRLRGSVFGLIGGRSIGMGSGENNPDQWFSIFGVDTEHIDQLEIIRRKDIVPKELIDNAAGWLENNLKSVDYDGGKLTRASLEEQIRCYYATRSVIAERKLDFTGVKCHYDLSEYYCTQCLSAAFLNDPYDWDGPKETFVFACEADSDGALTMQILKLISGKPVLFADFRHYDAEAGLFIFCNCGAMATWYAQQSPDPLVNAGKVSLRPVIQKYGGSGAHIQFIAAECEEITLCRLTRDNNGYRLTAFTGKIVRVPEDKVNETCSAWPHAYVAVGAEPYGLIEMYDNNHVHGVPGNYIAELKKFCELTGIGFRLITV